MGSKLVNEREYIYIILYLFIFSLSTVRKYTVGFKCHFYTLLLQIHRKIKKRNVFFNQTEDEMIQTNCTIFLGGAVLVLWLLGLR